MYRHPLRRLDMALRRDIPLGSLLDRLAAIHGDRVMATEHIAGRVVTYSSAAELVARWSDAIAKRASPGDPVVVATPNGYEQFLLCLAVARAGCLPAPVNDQMRTAEIDHVVADAGATFVLRSVRQLRGSAPVIAAATPAMSDVAALFYTSGTTGSPKGAALTHRSLVSPPAAAVLWPANLRSDEVLSALPVAHIMGFMTYVGLATAGISCYLMERFAADEVLEVIEARSCTGFIGVPTMYRKLAEAGAANRNLSSIRIWGSGADVIAPELVSLFKKLGSSAQLPVVGAVGEAAFVEGYGMVEVGGGVAAKISPPMIPARLASSVGFKLPGYSFRIVDPEERQVGLGGIGELWVKGPGVLREYWHAPDATADALTPDGWLRTGDLVRRGPLGTIMFQGRSKHVIKSGGFSVYPLEIETALGEHPDVLESSVVGLADESLGEFPVAAVRLRPKARVTAAELVTWSQERLARYKAPRQVILVDDFERTGTGKIQKDRVVALFGDSSTDEGSG